jgi:uncharacterized protein
VIYLDPTAIMKLIIVTPESPALADYLHVHTDTTWFTCALSRADVMRDATATGSPDVTEQAQHVLAGLDLVAVTDRLLDAAIALRPAARRTINALHIAAALSAGPRLQSMITYDPELAHDAADHHISAIHPGGSLCCAP